MGLFDFFRPKKKDPAVQVTAPKTVTTPTNADNDYVNAVFLSIHKGPPHPHNAVAHLGWPSYKLGIRDATAKHQELFSKGYFREARPDEILSTYRVAEIKEMLNSHGVTATGKKAVLIDALLEQVPPDELKLPELFRLSSKGWDFIEQHEDLLQLFKNPYNITYEEYSAAKAEAPYLKYNDVIWRIFNKTELETPFDDCFKRKHIRLYQAMLLQSEGRFADSLERYIAFLYFDLNRSEFYWAIQGNRISKEPEDAIHTDFKAQKAIFELKEHFRPEMIDRVCRSGSLPRVIVERQDFEKAVANIFEGKEIDIRDYLPPTVK